MKPKKNQSFLIDSYIKSSNRLNVIPNGGAEENRTPVRK